MLMITDNPEHRALVALCGLCGLRVSEARAIMTHDIDAFHPEPAGPMIEVSGKGNKYRLIPLTKTAWAFIRPRYAQLTVLQPGAHGSPLVTYSDRGARTLITDLAKKAGLSRPVASHDLRATFATAAYEKCHDLRVVQELLGHASSDTTEVYTGVRIASMRAAAEIA